VSKLLLSARLWHGTLQHGTGPPSPGLWLSVGLSPVLWTNESGAPSQRLPIRKQPLSHHQRRAWEVLGWNRPSSYTRCCHQCKCVMTTTANR
jgi:hypothetical protein